MAAALKNGTVLNYTAELPENKRKILYVDTEQSTYHCEIVARRSLRMAGLPTDSNHENLEFLVLRKYTPRRAHSNREGGNLPYRECWDW